MSDSDFKNIHNGGYSQHGECDPLKAILSDSGYFLEIGAFSPFTFSNTRFLVERGWSGCYVDGCSYAISRFINEYKNNENIKIVQALIGEEDKLVEFYNSLEDAVSTSDINFMHRWKSGGHPFKKIYTSMITMKSLETILPPVVDFINVDVEGYSAKLATYIDYNKLNTKVVCIEHDSQLEMLNRHMSLYGFVPYWVNHTNIIYKK
jgi:hypothetical protein